MPETQKSSDGLDMNEFLGLERTPEEETPVQESDSVEQEAVEETPVEKTDSEDAAAEATEEATQEKTETPDKLEDDRRFFQTKYQDTKRQLDEIKSKYAAQIETPAQETPKEVEKNNVSDLREALGQTGKAMSDEELREVLRDDPILAMNIAEIRNRQIFNEILDERDRRAQKDKAALDMKAEEAEARAVFEQWRADNKVSDEEINKVTQEMVTGGIKGRPTAITEHVIKGVLMNRFMSGAATKMKEVEADVAQKVKTQALTRQPQGGGKDTEKVKPIEDILASKFGGSRTSEVLKGLFG